MKYKVFVRTEIRSEPSVDRGVLYGILEPGFMVDIVHQEKELDSENFWLKDTNGFFYRKEDMEESILSDSANEFNFNLNLKAPWLSENFDISSIWSQSTGKGVSVAIIDTGIFAHSDISENIDLTYQKTFIGNSVRDIDGHGTHVAGIIGAKGYQNLIGVAPNVKMIPIKVVERENDKIDTLRLIDAIEYATSISEVRIINMSFKANQKDYNYGKLSSAIQKAISKGVVFVSASGNDWGNFVASPANLDNVIAVSALKRFPSNIEQYKLPLFANHGKRVDTSCIGYEILSCGINGQTTSIKSGTSMASAYVSGLIALKIQILTAGQIEINPLKIKDDLRASIFSQAYRENNNNIFLPIINPIKFLIT